MNVNGISVSSNFYDLKTVNDNNNSQQAEALNLKRSDQKSNEYKIKRADEFLIKHDALYAEQMSAVMNTINDGMQTAHQIYMRIAGGAKVSPEDERSLMQYDYKMYMAAKNAQMMSQRRKDLSDGSLIEKFEKRHVNDRKDWTMGSEQNTQEIQQNNEATETVSTTSENVFKPINIII